MSVSVPVSVSVAETVAGNGTESESWSVEVMYPRSMTSARYPLGVLWLSAGVFLITGAIFTVMPQVMFARLGLFVPDGAPVTELRAVYGGLEIGIGLFLLLCARRRGVALELGLVLSFLLFSGLAAYRGIGMGIDEPQVDLMSVLLVLESAGAVIALSGLLVLSRG